jgi:transcriptional regulator with XRE-family HTH domain
MKDRNIDIGQRIKKALEKAKKQQKALADKMGVSQSSVSNCLSGVNKVPIEMVIATAELTGVTLDWLITGEGPMSRSEVCPHEDTIKITYPTDQDLTDEYVDRLVKEDLVKYCAQLGANQVVAERMLRETMAEIKEVAKLPEGDQFGDLGDMINDAQRHIEKRTGRQCQPVPEEE